MPFFDEYWLKKCKIFNMVCIEISLECVTSRLVVGLRVEYSLVQPLLPHVKYNCVMGHCGCDGESCDVMVRVTG